MAVAAESSHSLQIEECDLDEPVLNKTSFVDLFRCMNYPLTVKYASGNHIAKEAIFKF